MYRVGFALLLLLAAGSVSAQGELVCSETRHFESIHSDFIWTFQAVAGERYSFESRRLTLPYTIELMIFRGEPLASAEVVSSSEPARICDWEAPETGTYLLIQATTAVQSRTWAAIKSLFR